MAEQAATSPTQVAAVARPGDTKMLRLAREIAMDIQTIEEILGSLGISEAEYEVIQRSEHFRRVLTSEVEAWNSASNTGERVRLKSLSFVEEALPEFFARAHDPTEALQHKTKVLEVVSRLAGLGVGGGVDTALGGEKFSVTINLGQDHTLNFTKDVTPQVTVLEHDADE